MSVVNGRSVSSARSTLILLGSAVMISRWDPRERVILLPVLKDILLIVVSLLVGVLIERPISRYLDHRGDERVARGHAAVLAKAKARVGSEGETVQLGSEELFVLQFDPGGLRHVRCRRLAHERTLDELLEAAPAGLLPRPAAELRAEVEERRQLLAADQDEARRRGVQEWNGRRFALRAAQVRRSGAQEEVALDLTFGTSDYATFEVLHQAWAMSRMAVHGASILDGEHLRTVHPWLSHSFGLNATLRTADGRWVFTRRNREASSRRGGMHIAVNEGLDLRDVDPFGQPDLVGCLLRGVREELGPALDQRAAVLHAVVLDVNRYQWAALGHLDLRDTEITEAYLRQARAVGHPHDDWESSGLWSAPDDLDQLLALVAEPTAWIAHGWLNLVLSLIHVWPGEADGILRKTLAATAGVG